MAKATSTAGRTVQMRCAAAARGDDAASGLKRSKVRAAAYPRKMAIPPVRGMGSRWSLRGLGWSTQPQRRHRIRQAGVISRASSSAETAKTARDIMEFRGTILNTCGTD